MNTLRTIAPPAARQLINEYCYHVPLMRGAYVAGGTVRSLYSGEPVRDLDVFFESVDAWNVGGQILHTDPDWKQTTATECAQTFEKDGLKVQLVRKFFESPQEAITRFDFSVSSAALIFGSEWRVIGVEQFFKDVYTKRLRILNLPNPLDTLRRMPRFIDRGYQPTSEDVQKLYEAISADCLLGKEEWYDKNEQGKEEQARAAAMVDDYDPFAED